MGKLSIKCPTFIKKHPKIILSVVAVLVAAVLVVVTLFSGRVYITTQELSANAATFYEPQAVEGEVPYGEGFVSVAETDAYSLEWDADRSLFRVVSKTDGTIWNSGYGFDNLDDYRKRDQRLMTSLLQISFLDSTGVEISLNNTADECTLETSLITDGIALHFAFVREMYIYDDEGNEIPYGEPTSIQITLQLWLDSYGLAVRIPEDGIKEEGEWNLLTVDVLPAFGSMLTGDDGYILHPDGSGSLLECNTPGKTPGIHAMSIYSNPYMDLKKLKDAYAEGETQIVVPYFGSAMRSQNGFIAYVEKGAESANMTLSLGSGVAPLNRLYTQAVYRFSRKMVSSQGVKATMFSSERQNLDYRVRYCLLNKTNTTYSDMAVKLRGFMQDNNLLPKESKVQNKIATTVEWLIAVRQNDMLKTGNLVMSSFDYVSGALNELEAAGVTDTKSLLLGWQKEGYGIYPLSSNVEGGAGNLSALLKTGNENRVFILETDYVQASSDGSFDQRQDAVVDFMRTVVSDEEGKLFLLNSLRQYDKFTRRDMERYLSFGTQGVGFSSLGRFLPLDYSNGRETSAADTRNAYIGMLKAAKENGLMVATQTGNAYLLANSDFIYNAYDTTSGVHAFTQEIPFYQMLVHGLIAYTGVTPGNMSADFTAMKLKWVEYGSVPYFLLSEQSSAMMQNAVVSDVFNSCYDDWKDLVVEVHKEFNERLALLANQQMVRHEVLSEGVSCVTYANGSVLVVNYNETPAVTAYGTVPAQDYAVFAGGEG